MERVAHIIKDSVNRGDWKPLVFGKSDTKLSHISFADDMVLFGESSINQIEAMKRCLNLFCEAFRAKVSVQKTKILFSKNTPNNLS